MYKLIITAMLLSAPSPSVESLDGYHESLSGCLAAGKKQVERLQEFKHMQEYYIYYSCKKVEVSHG